MVRTVSVNSLLIAVLCLTGTVIGQEPEAPTADVHARRMLAVVDAVVSQSVHPPTRQELVLKICRALGQTQPDLAETISNASAEGLLEILQDATSRTMKRFPGDPGRPGQALQQALWHIPGSPMVSTAENHRINTQVAENRYVGTGIQLSMTPGATMQKVFEDGPAWNVGAKDGDLILSIDGESTEDMSIVEVVQKLRGPVGSKVDVELRQPGSEEVRAYTVTRGVVPIATVSKPRFAEGNKRIGYVRLTAIGASTVHELRKIASRIPDETEHIVLDFRALSARHLHHARILASSLLDGKSLGAVQTRAGIEKTDAESDALFADAELTILIDNRTRGTAEWIAAALRDNQRATLIGQPTAGSGFVHKPFPVVDELVVEIPVGRLLRISGAPIAEAGDLTVQIAEPHGESREPGGPVRPDFAAMLTAVPPPENVPDQQVAEIVSFVEALQSRRASSDGTAG